jgi:Ribonuclease G/E
MDLVAEELESELERLKERLREVKELIEEFTHLWDTGSLYPDGERLVTEIRDVVDSIDV